MKKIIITAFFLVLPTFSLAQNDVIFTNDALINIKTYDTASSTSVTVASGSVATNYNIQLSYIDITLDNLSSTTFKTNLPGEYLSISQQSGSSDYSITTSCPTTNATLRGTGSTAVLRLKVLTTDNCSLSTGGRRHRTDYSTTTEEEMMLGATSTSDMVTIIGTSTPEVFPTQATTSTTKELQPITNVNKLSVSDIKDLNILYQNLTQEFKQSKAIPFIFTKDLYLGITDDEVLMLQKFLNQNGFQVSKIGAGSPGKETKYFGSLTYSSVKKYQEKFKIDILKPLSLSRGTGYFGPSTRKAVNALNYFQFSK